MPSESDSDLEEGESPPQSPLTTVTHSYSLKVINPVKKSQFTTAKLQGSPKNCKTIPELKKYITTTVPQSLGLPPLDVSKSEVGYVEPGHGAKGKRHWLHTVADLKEMYEKHERKKDVLLWCYSDASKDTKKGKEVHPSRYDNHTKKMAEVDDIVKKLEEKHEGKYTPEQFRTWAHMLHMQKHASYDAPPDKPFFRGKKRPCPQDLSSFAPTSKCPTTAAVSPARRLNMRTELIDQLQKWHNLREMGAISHDHLQQTILTDLKKL